MHPKDLKFKAVIHYVEFLPSLRKVANRYGIGKSTLSRWVRQSGKHPRPRKRRRTIYHIIATTLVREIDAQPLMTASDMTHVVHEHHGFNVSTTTIYRCLRRLQYSCKKAQRSRVHQRLDPTHPFFARSSPYAANAISIDEASFCSSDRPRKGWGPRGHRVPKQRPGRRYHLSLLLAIGYEGIIGYRMIRGGVNGAKFANFIEELPCGRPLIIDNASIHKTLVVRALMASKKICPMYIPPYSPWYNPIEFSFSWMKRQFRRDSLRVNRSATLESRVEKVLCDVPDIQPYFRHCSRIWAEDTFRVREMVCTHHGTIST